MEKSGSDDTSRASVSQARTEKLAADQNKKLKQHCPGGGPSRPEDRGAIGHNTYTRGQKFNDASL